MTSVEQDEYVHLREKPKDCSSLREQLCAHAQRTGITPEILLRNASDMPPGLRPALVRGWMDGKVDKVSRVHLDYVLCRWQVIPDALGPKRRSTPRAPASAPTPGIERISPEDLAMLQTHRARTGLGPARMLKGATDIPEGLQPHMISTWLSGRTPRAKPEYLNYVLKRYAAVPSKS